MVASSRPDLGNVTEQDSIIAFSGRVGFRPNEAGMFGLSASEGHIFRQEAEPRLPAGRESMIIVSVSFWVRMPVLHGAICKYGSCLRSGAQVPVERRHIRVCT